MISKIFRQKLAERIVVYPLLGAAIAYVLLSYILLPEFWIHYEHHPSLSSVQKITYTKEGIEGDPVNVMIAGTEKDLIKAMLEAGWTPADKITLKTAVKTALYVLLDKKYPSAPVSGLYLFGRLQDLSFEIEIDPRLHERHHVRFWRVKGRTPDGPLIWAGAATFDSQIEFSRYTGEITHRISPDIDSERDLLVEKLVRSGLVERYYQVSGIGPSFSRKNGNGDLYYTDGEISVAVLNPGAIRASAAPEKLSSPAIIETKNSFFRAFGNFFKRTNSSK